MGARLSAAVRLRDRHHSDPQRLDRGRKGGVASSRRSLVTFFDAGGRGLMGEWMSCPGCQLRHTRRPDGLCPRCKQPVDGAAAAADMAAAEVPADPMGAPPAAPSSALRMGNLAQSARGGTLKSARGIMLFVGIMSALANAFFYSQEEIDKELKKLGPGFVVDQAKLSELKGQAVRATRLINGGGVMLGLVFIACAALVQRHPVPVTITALALYLGGNAIFGFINPASLAAGFVVKIFIVIGLFKAVQAAIAYQKELAT